MNKLKYLLSLSCVFAILSTCDSVVEQHTMNPQDVEYSFLLNHFGLNDKKDDTVNVLVNRYDALIWDHVRYDAFIPLGTDTLCINIWSNPGTPQDTRDNIHLLITQDESVDCDGPLQYIFKKVYNIQFEKCKSVCIVYELGRRDLVTRRIVEMKAFSECLSCQRCGKRRRHTG